MVLILIGSSGFSETKHTHLQKDCRKQNIHNKGAKHELTRKQSRIKTKDIELQVNPYIQSGSLTYTFTIFIKRSSEERK